MVQKLGRTKIFLKAGKISAKDSILTIQDKQRANIGNKTNMSLKMNPQKTIGRGTAVEGGQDANDLSSAE